MDASARDVEGQIKAVEVILTELDLEQIPRIVVFNKCDRLRADEAEALCRRYDALGISALHPSTLVPMIALLEQTLAEKCVRLPAAPVEVCDQAQQSVESGIGMS